jgi:hypothetical protein
VVEPSAASLGQVGTREDAAFYLLTRYLVQCLNTGALAVFRFKFDTSMQDSLYGTEAPLKLQRSDTLGYMLWYLKYVYERQGWSRRPDDATYKEDLQVLGKFWRRELKHNGSLLWCTEVEQRVLVGIFMNQLYLERNLLFPQVKAEHQPSCKALIEELDVNIDSSLCFQDMQLRVYLQRALFVDML